MNPLVIGLVGFAILRPKRARVGDLATFREKLKQRGRDARIVPRKTADLYTLDRAKLLLLKRYLEDFYHQTEHVRLRDLKGIIRAAKNTKDLMEQIDETVDDADNKWTLLSSITRDPEAHYADAIRRQIQKRAGSTAAEDQLLISALKELQEHPQSLDDYQQEIDSLVKAMIEHAQHPLQLKKKREARRLKKISTPES